MKGKTHLRRASPDDYRTFYGKPAPEIDWAGFCAIRDGEVIAFGNVWLDPEGRAWFGTDRASEVPPLMLHRAIRDFLAALQQEGIPALYALCDERIPAATRWLTRLGFAIDEAMPLMYMPTVESYLPVWRRNLNNGMER
jgi:hypothetical protein